MTGVRGRSGFRTDQRFKGAASGRMIWWLVTALLGLLPLSVERVAQADINQAYQREMSFLVAERDAQQARLAELEKESSAKIAAATADVDRLQGMALALSMQGERLTEMLSDVEREADGVAEGGDQLESILAQASAALEKGGVSLPEPASGEGVDTALDELNRVQFAFTNGVSLLRTFGKVRKEKGTFFDAAGQKIDGEIIRLGQVGAFGVSDQQAGTLAPAGGERLKIWPEPGAAQIAQQIASGAQPDRIKVFLFESLEKGVEKRAEPTPVEVIESGGVIGWVIVWAGVVALIMALLRAFFLWRAAANTNTLLEKITPLVETRKFTQAIEICQKAKSAGGRVLVATLKNIHRDRQELEDIVQEAILHEQPVLDRFGSSIIVIAAVAPLLGLLGTVTGMIATFDIITEFGTGNPKLLSGGIAIALVTTELGLIVAIPALILGNMLSSWAEGIKDSIDKAALRVTNVSTGVRLSEPPGPVSSRTGDLAEPAPAAG